MVKTVKKGEKIH